MEVELLAYHVRGIDVGAYVQEHFNNGQMPVSRGGGESTLRTLWGKNRQSKKETQTHS